MPKKRAATLSALAIAGVAAGMLSAAPAQAASVADIGVDITSISIPNKTVIVDEKMDKQDAISMDATVKYNFNKAKYPYKTSSAFEVLGPEGNFVSLDSREPKLPTATKNGVSMMFGGSYYRPYNKTRGVKQIASSVVVDTNNILTVQSPTATDTSYTRSGTLTITGRSKTTLAATRTGTNVKFTGTNKAFSTNTWAYINKAEAVNIQAKQADGTWKTIKTVTPSSGAFSVTVTETNSTAKTYRATTAASGVLDTAATSASVTK